MIAFKEAHRYFGETISEGNTSELLYTSITRYDPFYQTEKHYHANPYLSILVKGSYKELGIKFHSTITPFDLIFRPAGYEHENFFGPNGGVCLNIEFDSRLDIYFVKEVFLPQKTMIFHGEVPNVLGILRKLEQRGNEVMDILPYFVSFFSNVKPTKKSKQLVDVAIGILKKDISMNYSVSLLAERLQVNPIYLSRMFKYYTGNTVSEYHIGLKLACALKDVVGSDWSISKITHEYGFYDDSHFIRNFQQVFGISPYQLRLRIKM